MPKFLEISKKLYPDANFFDLRNEKIIKNLISSLPLVFLIFLTQTMKKNILKSLKLN